jgi:hypothetical protein
LTSNGALGRDLRAYLSAHGPVPPHRAALLVASLAEQLSVVHAEGSAYREIGPETVHVTGSGLRAGVSLSGQVVPLNDAGVAANVRAAGGLLAWLLGATPGGGRPESAPPSLWRVVDSATGTDDASRPGAALLARQLRDAARDLLLEVSPPAASMPIPVAAPRYVPASDMIAAPPRGRRSRWTGRALLIGASSVLAIGIAGMGILLPAAGIRLPVAKGGLAQMASRGIAAASPTGTAPTASAVGAGSASDQHATPPASAAGTPRVTPAAPAKAGGTSSPPTSPPNQCVNPGHTIPCWARTRNPGVGNQGCAGSSPVPFFLRSGGISCIRSNESVKISCFYQGNPVIDHDGLQDHVIQEDGGARKDDGHIPNAFIDLDGNLPNSPAIGIHTC